MSINRGNAYLKALREHLPHVSISFDPFHIIKNVNDAVDEVRRELCKSLEKEEKKLIKGKRYLFLCGEEKLTDDKRVELDKILQINQPLQEAYLLKEKLWLVFHFSSFKKCATVFGEWIALAEASTLKPFDRLAKTLSRHAQQVLNFFRYRLTSGRIEGMNSMIARIQLKNRGLPSVDYLRLKLRQLTSPSFTRLFDAAPKNHLLSHFALQFSTQRRSELSRVFFSFCSSVCLLDYTSRAILCTRKRGLKQLS